MSFYKDIPKPGSLREPYQPGEPIAPRCGDWGGKSFAPALHSLYAAAYNLASRLGQSAAAVRLYAWFPQYYLPDHSRSDIAFVDYDGAAYWLGAQHRKGSGGTLNVESQSYLLTEERPPKDFSYRRLPKTDLFVIPALHLTCNNLGAQNPTFVERFHNLNCQRCPAILARYYYQSLWMCVSCYETARAPSTKPESSDGADEIFYRGY